MASIKVLLYKSNPKSDGSFPIVIRVIQNRKTVYHQLGYSVKEKDWDSKEGIVKKSYPNFTRLNFLIAKKKLEVTEIMMIADQENKELSPKLLKHKIKTNNKSSFQTVAKEHLSDLLKLNKFNQHSGERPRVEHFNKFLDGTDISFQNIDAPLLKKFMIYLKTEAGLSDRSVMNNLVVMRTIFNRAINEGLVESKFYPFGPGKIMIKFNETHKVGLNAQEVKSLEDLDLSTNSFQFNALNVWLSSFYLAGIRISDIIQLKWKDLYDGRLSYVMGKNNKVVSLGLPEKAINIINHYKERKGKSIFVFPYLKDEIIKDPRLLNERTRSANSQINLQLGRIAKEVGISKKLTMHISRHTFGQIAGDKISPQQLQKLYRHSDLKTTLGYQANFIHKDVDDALESVLDF
jgi:integrase/recombinase XerD